MNRRIIEIACMMFMMIVVLLMFKVTKVRADIKPSVREESVTIFTDSDPYVFHFFNALNPTSVQYTSSDTSIITIKDSEAIPKKAGKATVGIEMIQDGTRYNFSVKFTVKNPPKEKAKTDYKKAAEKERAKLKKTATTRSNTILNVEHEKICKTTAELDKVMYEKIYKYSSFGIYISSFKILRSAAEYLSLFPGIKHIEFSEPNVYTNAISIRVKQEGDDADPMHEDECHVLYALVTGRVSYLSKNEKKIYDKIQKIAKGLRETSDYGTVLNVHDYIAEHYEYEYDESVRERYKVSYMLEKGKGVCSSYSKLFCLLCRALNINARYVLGSEEFNHGWNIVEIAHKWYQVDVTWDDLGDDEATGESKLRYDYFLIPDEIMSIDHEWDTTQYPKCTSKDLCLMYTNLEQYVVLSGLTETLDYLEKQVKAWAYSGGTELSLTIAETEASDETLYEVGKSLSSQMYMYGLKRYSWSIRYGERCYIYQICFEKW